MRTQIWVALWNAQFLLKPIFTNLA